MHLVAAAVLSESARVRTTEDSDFDGWVRCQDKWHDNQKLFQHFDDDFKSEMVEDFLNSPL